MSEFQCILGAPGPLGMKLDKLKLHRHDIFDDRLPLLRLLEEHFPERSSYTKRFFDSSRSISGLMQVLQEHCRDERDPVLTAARVATVVNVVLEESTIEIQNCQHENANSFAHAAEEEEYKLQRLQDQLQLFVNGLVQKNLGDPSRKVAQARELDSAFAHSMDSPLGMTI